MTGLRGLAGRMEVLGAAAVLVVIAVVLGYVMLGDDSSSASGGGHVHGAAGEVHGDGLSDSHDGFRLVVEELPEETGKEVPVSFTILNESGKPQTRYRVNHEKKLHMLVLRDDMHAFQHVHPELDGDTWRTTVSIPDGGQYRFFAEFVPDGDDAKAHPTLLGKPFVVAGDTEHVPLPEPVDEVEVDGFVVSRSGGPAQPAVDKPNELKFRIADAGGKPAELETYLGSYAHVSAFNAMTMAATHLHPLEKPGVPLDDGELSVRAEFEQRGEHRVFVEFQVDGKVHVAPFTVFAT